MTQLSKLTSLPSPLMSVITLRSVSGRSTSEHLIGMKSLTLVMLGLFDQQPLLDPWRVILESKWSIQIIKISCIFQEEKENLLIFPPPWLIRAIFSTLSKVTNLTYIPNFMIVAVPSTQKHLWSVQHFKGECLVSNEA